MLLQDKIALVYGAAGAVGRAVSRAFAREGAKVVLAGRTVGSLDNVHRQIGAEGGRSEVVPVDALDAASVSAHLERVVERTGPVKIMFNAIGWDDVQGEAMSEMGEEAFMTPIVRGVRSWYLTGGALGRHMVENGGGVIIGITANAGRYPYPNVGGFGVACAAVEHYLHQLGSEIGPMGVRVCCVRSSGSPDSPGLREVFTLHAANAGLTLEEFERQAGAGAALRHLPSLAEVADAVVLMASDHARAMTATTANVTCGGNID